MRFFVLTAALIVSFVTSAFAHPGHSDHMIAPGLWHALGDPLHLVFLAGVVGIGFVGWRAVRKLK